MDKGQIITTIIDLVNNIPNDKELGEAIRKLIKNKKG